MKLNFIFELCEQVKENVYFIHSYDWLIVKFFNISFKIYGIRLFTHYTITFWSGLDPAGPLWNYNRDRIAPSDGGYVECIHTDGGYTVGGLGIGSAICNADFFPNGGISQPGCLTNLCNHNRAWELFAATVTYNHLVGRRCTTSLQITWNTCSGTSLRMGNDDLRKTG